MYQTSAKPALFLLVIGLFLTFSQTAAAQSALDGFDPNANGTVRAIVVQPDGKILLGGDFTTVLGVTRNRIARLNSDGTLDTAFDPNAGNIVNDTVNTIAVQPDGKVLVGGRFTTIGGQTRNRIARLDAATGLADSWNPDASSIVNTIALQPDGKVLVGGSFSTIGGQTRNRLARLNATNGLADSFNPNVMGLVNSIVVQSDGKVLVGGQFTTIGGQTRSLFARLSNDTPALSTLAVTQTTLTLTRDGSAPQFCRVIFEQSTDNGATYTLLGTATNSRPTPAGKDIGDNQLAPSAAGYTLTGFILPAGQNVLIRARGFYSAGYRTGSGITEDKFQTAFFALSPTASGVTIGGYVLTHLGQAPRRATVTLTDLHGQVQSTTVNRWGRYQFNDLAPGRTYFVTVEAKGYNFTPPTQVLTPGFDVENLDFTAFAAR